MLLALPQSDASVSPSQVSAWVAALVSGPPEDTLIPLQSLNEWMETLETRFISPALFDEGRTREDLQDLSRIIRDSRGIESLTALISASVNEVHQGALLLLSNVASDTLNPAGHVQTRESLREADVLQQLLPHLWSQSRESRLYALGLLMNTSCAGDASAVEALDAAGVPGRLGELGQSGDKSLEYLARRCLLGYSEAVTMRTMQRHAKNPFVNVIISRRIACTVNFVLRLKVRLIKANNFRKMVKGAVAIQSAYRVRTARRQSKEMRRRSTR